MNLQLIGECKSSIDPLKFLFAIPESGDLRNKVFIGPILSNLQTAYGVRRNIEVASRFLSKFGEVHIASNIRDTSKKFVMGNKESKQDNTPDYEKIFDICEETILPAVNCTYLRWRTFALQDYIFSFPQLRAEVAYFQKELLEGKHFVFNVIVPIIVTSKPILIPQIKDGNVSDVGPTGFVLYEHSVMKPNDYFGLVDVSRDIAIFVSTENGFDELMNYIDDLADKIFEITTRNLTRQPSRFFQDFQEIEKHEEEIQAKKG